MKIPTHKKVVVLHCLATRKSWGLKKSIDWVVGEVRKWHVRDRGWDDIAYAIIIGFGGGIGLGRDRDNDGDVWDETGAGAKGWNVNGIHLALVGGYGAAADDEFFDHFTRAQEIALLKQLKEIEELSGRTLVAVADIAELKALGPHQLGLMGHNQLANKGCPGFNVKSWYDSHQSKPKHVPAQSSFQLPAWLLRILRGDFR